MIGIAILINIYICIFSFYLRRDLLSPLFCYSFIWAVTLFLILLLPSDFYEMDFISDLAFSLGSIGFLFGYILSEILNYYFPKREIKKNNLLIRYKILLSIFLILLIGWFEYFREVYLLTSQTVIFNFFREARYALVQASFNGEKLIGPIGNFEVISIYFAMLLAIEKDNIRQGNLLFFLSLLLSISYVILGGSKMGLVRLTLALFFIYSFNKRNVVIFKRGILSFLLVLSVFSTGLIFVNFTYQDFKGFELISELFIAIRNYWLGGPIAFNQILLNPEYFENTHSTSRFFLETANSLGSKFYVPNIHAQYVDISKVETTNVYTIYYSYFLDAGFLGIFFFSLIYGFVLGFCYLKAKIGDRRYLLMYSFLLTGLFFTIVSEGLFLSLNGIIKAFIFWWGLYLFNLLISKKHLR